MRSIVLEIDWATFRGCATSHDDSWWILDLYKRLFEMDLSKNGGTANMVMLMGTEFSGNVLSSPEKEKNRLFDRQHLADRNPQNVYDGF